MSLNYIQKFAPSLVMEYATLLPFDDCIVGVSAGPQKGGNDREYFTIETEDGEGNWETTWTVKKGLVIFENCDGEETASLPMLWEYLRQLPRKPHVFTKRMLEREFFKD